jgi:DNA helicase IV
MAWRMLVRRCPSRTMTVVGDIAQTSASWGAASWRAVLEPVAPGRWREEELTVNYRTPSEVMAVAADVLAAIDPALVPPTSVRDSGHPPVVVPADGDGLALAAAKGLEFDQVVLVEPALVADTGVNGLRDLYVSLTRPTQQLTIVHARGLPAELAALHN